MNPDADDLLLFARVVEAGSFSRAAERVQWPKSTVSRRIAALEQRLGEKLLQRSTRSLALTEFGQGMLEHARALAAEVDNALALAQHRRQSPPGGCASRCLAIWPTSCWRQPWRPLSRPTPRWRWNWICHRAAST